MKASSFASARCASASAFRISPADTNYFALLFDPAKDGIPNVFVLEIFNVGGATPPNTHLLAQEFFFVLHGEGVALCGGEELPIRKGDAFLLFPGAEHVVRNTGSSKLYTLTVMTPNEGFAELIRAGTPVPLDAEDLAVLTGLQHGQDRDGGHVAAAASQLGLKIPAECLSGVLHHSRLIQEHLDNLSSLPADETRPVPESF
jgi:mannose-6-phosphate isomerase-like protein (cupin superfamily)